MTWWQCEKKSQSPGLDSQQTLLGSQTLCAMLVSPSGTELKAVVSPWSTPGISHPNLTKTEKINKRVARTDTVRPLPGNYGEITLALVILCDFFLNVGIEMDRMKKSCDLKLRTSSPSGPSWQLKGSHGSSSSNRAPLQTQAHATLLVSSAPTPVLGQSDSALAFRHAHLQKSLAPNIFFANSDGSRIAGDWPCEHPEKGTFARALCCTA